MLIERIDDVLYGEVWLALSPRDRSLVTVSALVALNGPKQLHSHLGLAVTSVITVDVI